MSLVPQSRQRLSSLLGTRLLQSSVARLAPWRLGSVTFSQLVRPRVPYYCQGGADGSRRAYSSSFIQQVMDQVKNDAQLQASLKELKQTAAYSLSTSANGKIGSYVSEACKHVAAQLRNDAAVSQQVLSQMQTLPVFRSVITLISRCLSLWHGIQKYMSPGMLKVFGFMRRVLEDDETLARAREGLSQWKAAMEERHRAAAEAGLGNPTGERQGRDHHHFHTDAETESASSITDALVLSQESIWEKFGTRLKDMPFLRDLFDNPIIDRLWESSAQAAALQQMKSIDPTFRISDFVNVVEHVIVPHFLDCFLHGARDALKIHCSKAAFGAVEASLNSRTASHLVLDPTVLLLRHVEFRGATQMPEHPAPWFIFTFNAQQINCIRDSRGVVVAGAVDDIREITYSIALMRHPAADTTPGLQYPWQIMEFAVLGSVSSW